MASVKGFLKLVAALSIPTGLGLLFWYSQNEANREVKEYQKFQKAHPPAQNITVDNYELKEVNDANEVKWDLKAKQGTMESLTRDVDLHDVIVKTYDEGKMKMTLSAPTGLANEQTRLVKLTSTAQKLVRCENADGGAQLDAKKVELTKKNQFIATGGVTIVYPGVAKVTGNTVTGSLANSADLKDFTITGNTHATIGKM